MLHSLLLTAFISSVYGYYPESSFIKKGNMIYIPDVLGYRPQECVHFHEEHAILTPVDGGVQVYYPGSNTTKFQPALPQCVADAQILKQKRLEHLKNRQLGQNLTEWNTYVSDQLETNMGVFNSEYTLPGQTPDKSSNTILYFFVGMENYKQSDVSIIQPVVTYCEGCNGGANGWSMQAWNCCPSGQSNYGKAEGVSDSATVQGTMSVVGEEVTIGCASTGVTSSTLNVRTNGREFDWIDVTLETYNIEKCSEYNTQPFKFGSMKITDASGKSITPSWKSTQGNGCGGKVVVNNPLDVDIYGSSA